jgi:hypothetical protein
MSAAETSPGVPLPRGLIVLSCLWIAISWVMLFGLHPPIQAVAVSYTNSVRMMGISTMLGITIGWPLLRTSGRVFQAPLRQTLLDMVVLACAVQVTIWPLRLISIWSTTQTLFITCQLTSWIILYGALVHYGAGSRNGWIRSMVMFIAVSVVILGLLLAAPGDAAWWSPLEMLRELTDSPQGAPTNHALVAAAATTTAGLGLWILRGGIRWCGTPLATREFSE